MSESSPLVAQGKPSFSFRLSLRIFTVLVGCVLASGTLSGFPTLQPLLADAGAFSSLGSRASAMNRLSQVYTIASGVSIGLYLLIGWLYDRIGARKAGVVGALGVVVGMVLMSASLWSPRLSVLLYLALPLTDTAGFLNSMAVFGFIWHVPAYQATVLGLGNASAQLTAAMVFILVALVHAGLALKWAFLVFAVLALIAAVVTWLAAPSKQEVFAQVKVALGTCPPEMLEPRPLVGAIRDSLRVMNMHRGVTIVFFVSQASAYYLVQYWFAYYGEFAAAVFGRDEGARLSYWVSITYSVCGAALTPLLGPVLDRLGLFRFFCLSSVCFVVFAVTSLVGSVPAQLVSICAAMVFFCAWMTFLTKWGTVYCPPDLFGTYFGVIFSVIGVSQMLVNLVAPPVVRRWLGADSVNVFYFFFFVYGIVGVVGAIALIVALSCRPPPTTPPMLGPATDAATSSSIQ
mmetsp:Transcript_7983/g.25517  ORF Transcript_7983/g.25517 Transcript_7983/m.25517 type:complete len:459 (-) Transcript_7983:283-1659(-)